MYCLFQHVLHAFNLKNLGTVTLNTMIFISSDFYILKYEHDKIRCFVYRKNFVTEFHPTYRILAKKFEKNPKNVFVVLEYLNSILNMNACITNLECVLSDIHIS